MSMKIRKAAIDDIDSITSIYNYAIINTTATFDTKPRTLKSQEKWFYCHSKKHPILVSEDKEGVAGWASLSQWSERKAYERTAEVSVYVRKDRQGEGIGSCLTASIIDIARKNGFHILIARVVTENKASVNLAGKYGFTIAGSLKEVGYKFGRYIDVYLMQLMLDLIKSD